MKHKKTYIFLLFVLAITFSFAQNAPLKFDEIYPTLPSIKPSQGLYILNTFQKQNPEFSNTYVQIGNLCEKQLKLIDPLREYTRAMLWADNAILYYGVYFKFASKGDVGRNREYFANINIPISEKKLNDEDVDKYIRMRLDSCKNYKKNVTSIFETLSASKEHYDKSIQMYSHINKRFENMNELLLHTYDSMLRYIDTMIYNFNTSKDLFESYKNQLAKYPILNYNQQYELKDIETYRLDGLTNSDFLEPKFMVWNFNKWQHFYNSTFQNDILSLRNEIIGIQDNFSKNSFELENCDTVSADAEFKTYDDLFLYRLGRYDNYSIVKDFFRYLALKQQFLKYGNMPISNPTDSNLNVMNAKLRFYYNLTQMQCSVEKEAVEFSKKISAEKVERFSEFFNNYYLGTNGLREYAESESPNLKKYMTQDFNKLKSYLNNQISYKNSLGYVSYKKDSIALFVNENYVDSLGNSLKYYTTHVEYYQGSPVYLAGYLLKSNTKTAFLAKVNSQGIQWLNFQNLLNGKSVKFCSIYSYSQGCAAVISPINPDSVSLMVNYSLSGKVVFQKKVSNPFGAFKVKYNELEKKYALVFGEKINDTLPCADSTMKKHIFNSFKVQYIDSSGNQIWSTHIAQKGTFVDILISGNNYQAYINSLNYTEMASITNSQNEQPNHKWELSIVTIDADGKIINQNQVNSQLSLTINNTYKISNNQINLIGYMGENSSDKSNKLVYLIVTDSGELEYSNINW